MKRSTDDAEAHHRAGLCRPTCGGVADDAAPRSTLESARNSIARAAKALAGRVLRRRSGHPARATRRSIAIASAVLFCLLSAALPPCALAQTVDATVADVAEAAPAPIKATAPAEPAQRNDKEIATKQQLDKLRSEIKLLAERQKATEAQRGGVAVELRERENAIAAVAKELRVLDARLVDQQQALAALELQRTGLNEKLHQQRDVLATLLRSAYALGQHEELKLLLQQEEIATASRVLAYHRYFQRARIARIDELLADLAELAKVQQAIVEQNAELNATRSARSAEVASQMLERGKRQALLDQLDLDLKDQQTHLAALGKDEKALQELLERLRDVFADIPKQLSGAEPFGQRRGRLTWPLRGALAVNFGASDDSGRSISGIVVSGKTGNEVHAVSHGRVAYADWLKGYGLLLIVDHGDGYMSLYGYNESLLKDVGDWVDEGQPVATVGASGGRRNPGLYFELRLKGKPLDPRAWLKP
ncbi:MAG: peptidoglycan DD-metalloendopeptidase family protein [Tahibacter sp.]